MEACFEGHRECAQALIEANAAVDMADDGVLTALMLACDSAHHECAQVLIDAQADVELTNARGGNALMIATQSRRQNRIWWALALLEATALIQETDFPDRAASLKFACGRLQLIEVVLASTYVIEAAPPLASVNALKIDAQGIVVSFASEMLACATPRRRSRRLAAKRR